MKLSIIHLADGSVSLRGEDDNRHVFLSLACGEEYEHIPKHIKAAAIVAAADKVADYLIEQKDSYSRSEKALQKSVEEL